MGNLADTAKKISNYLKLEKGNTEVVTFISYRIIPSNLDPNKDTVQYKFATIHGEKFWTNGNSNIMMFFDPLKGGEVVAIKRDAWINKKGEEDPSKSSYKVKLIQNADGTKPIEAPSAPLIQEQSNAPEKSWQAANPGNIIDPKDIAW